MKKISNLLILVSVALLTLSSCSGGGSVVEKPAYDTKYVPAYANDKAFYIDLSTGKKVKNYKEYEDADYFYDGIARIKTKDGYSFINSDFKPITKDVYVDATQFSEGIALVVKENGKIQGINDDGKVIFTLDKAEYASSFFDGVSIIAGADKKFGLIDTKGNIIIDLKDYVDVKERPHDGHLIVAKEYKNGKKWGVIDYKGKEILPCEYENVTYTLVDDMFSVMQTDNNYDDKWGVRDKDNKEIIPCRYSGPVVMLKNGIGVFQNVYNGNIRCGLVNREGEEIIEPRFKDITYFNMGLAAVLDPESETCGYIDEEGKVVIEPQFLIATPFFENGTAIVKNKNTEMWGVINKDAEYIINSDYDGIAFFGEDMYIVEKSNDNFTKRGIINDEGKEIVVLSDLYRFKPVPNVKPFEKVRNNYVDVDGIVNTLVENLKEINKHEISFSSLSETYDFNIDYGWKQLSRVENKDVVSYFNIYIDSEYNYSDDFVRYYGTSLTFEYDIKYGSKASLKDTEIFNAFAKRLNAPASVYESEKNEIMEVTCDSVAVDGIADPNEIHRDGEFKCPILNNRTCRFVGRRLYIIEDQRF